MKIKTLTIIATSLILLSSVSFADYVPMNGILAKDVADADKQFQKLALDCTTDSDCEAKYGEIVVGNYCVEGKNVQYAYPSKYPVGFINGYASKCE